MKRNNFFIISALLIVGLFLGLASVSAASSDIYVSPSGNDSSNNGTVDSPYHSIGKAVNQSNDSSNVNIYLDEGTYRGQNNTNIEINKAHISQGGSISIIGKGKDKTFIDGDSISFIFDIKADSIVHLYNLTIRNCKNTYGGAITNNGNLSINGCNFENNYATSYGGAIKCDNPVDLNIINSKFNNNSALDFAAAIYSPLIKLNNCNFTNNIADSNIIYSSNANSFVYNCYFINNTINSTSSWIYGTLYMYGGSIVNNTFINCSAPNSDSTPTLYIGGTIYLKNNTIVDCFNKNNINFIKSDYANFNSNLIFLGNSTINVNKPSNIRLTALLTDDMGNVINGGTVYFIINGILNKSNSTNASGIATYTFTQLFDDGLYVVSGYVGSENLTSVRTGIINVSIDRSPVTYYVSNSGNDDSGDGTEDNPFKTIQNAINRGFAVSIYPTIIIKDGVYKGIGNVNMSFNDLGILTIIGSVNTILDGEVQNWLFKFGSYTQVNLVNLTIANFSGKSEYPTEIIIQFSDAGFNITGCNFVNNTNYTLIYGGGYNSVKNIINCTFNSNHDMNHLVILEGDCFIDNCSFINNSGIVYAASDYNDRSSILNIRNGIINNSRFINNTIVSSDYDSAILYVNGIAQTYNNKFINNTILESPKSYTGGSALKGTVNSTNDYFENNVAIRGGAFSGSGNFTNVTFKNNRALQYGGAIYLTGLLNLTNCTFSNNNATLNGKDIYVYGYIYGLTYTGGKIDGFDLVFKSINTTLIRNYLIANFVNDDGIVIGGTNVSFYANGTYLGVAELINGEARLNVVGLNNGIYQITGEYQGAGNDTSITSGVLNISSSILDSLDVYVATNGSDTNGTGSIDNPFATIIKAINVGLERTQNLRVHLAEGTYSGSGNVNITLPGSVNLTIAGAGMNKTILYGDSVNWAFFNNFGECVSTIANLTIANFNTQGSSKGGATSGFGIVHNLGNLIVEGCNFKNSNGTALVNERDSAGNRDVTLASYWGNLTVKNCYFTNNTGGYNGGALANFANAYIYNSVFDANNCTNYGSEIFTGYYTQNTTYTYLVNTTIKNTLQNKSNSGAVYLGGENVFINCSFINNIKSMGISGSSGIVKISLIGSVFNNTGNFYIYAGNLWNIVNSTFENIDSGIGIGYPGITSYISGSTFKNITGGLTLNGNTSIKDSCIYAPLTLSRGGLYVYDLDYNWWGNNSKPEPIMGAGSSNITINLNYWIVMALVNTGSPGLTQNISVVSRAIDNNGTLHYYDTSNIPIPPEDREFILEVVNDTGSITPNEGNVSDYGFNSTFIGNDYGNHTVKAAFKNFNSSKTFEIYKLETTTNVTVSNPKGKNGSTIIITANVKDNQGNPVNGGIVEFFFNGKSLGNITVENGVAVFNWVINEPNVSHEIYAEYHKNDAYNGSVQTTPFEVLTIPTNITTDLSKTNGNRGDKVLITVNVRDNNGILVNSGFVEVYVNGVYLGTLDVVGGKAYVNWTVSGNPGKVSVIANYTDDYTYVDNQKTTSFEINKIKTSTSMSNSKGTYGKNTVLKATLKDASGKAVVGRYVKFYVNNKYVGQAKTNSQGLAALNYKVKNTGSLTIKAISVSDGTYQSSTRSSKLSVPKLSKVKIKNSYAVKGKKITFKTLLANFGPDKSSLVISYKLPKGVKLLKRSLTSGLVKYNKRTGILSWTVKNLKLSKSKSAILTVSLSAKKGKYYIKNSVKKSVGSVVYGNNALKNIKIK